VEQVSKESSEMLTDGCGIDYATAFGPEASGEELEQSGNHELK